MGYKLDPHRSHNGMAVVTGNTVRVRLIELRGNHTLVAGGLASKPNAFGGLHYIDARTMPGAPADIGVAGQKRHVESFGERHICRVVGREVLPERPHTRSSWKSCG